MAIRFKWITSFFFSVKTYWIFWQISSLTQKLADYLLFRQAFELIKNKEHLTVEGLNKLVAIKASINWGHGLRPTDSLKEAFPGIEPVKRLVVPNKEILDPNWLSGFTSGEGSFSVRVYDSSHNISGSQVSLRFQLTQQMLRTWFSVNGKHSRVFKLW